MPNRLDYSIVHRVVGSVFEEKIEAPVNIGSHNSKECLSAEENNDNGKHNGSQAVGELVDAYLHVFAYFSILSVLYRRV